MAVLKNIGCFYNIHTFFQTLHIELRLLNILIRAHPFTFYRKNLNLLQSTLTLQYKITILSEPCIGEQPVLNRF